MTIDQLVKGYVDRINGASNKEYETRKIIDDIKTLTYTDGNPITQNTQLQILEQLRDSISAIIIKENHSTFAQDNSEHLELIDQAIKMLGGK